MAIGSRRPQQLPSWAWGPETLPARSPPDHDLPRRRAYHHAASALCVSMGRNSRVPPAADTPYVVEVLGHFAVRVVDVGELEFSALAQRVVAVVAIRERVSREQIAAMLWPDYDDAAALGRMRDVLYRIRTVAPELLISHGHQLSLGSRVDVDVRRARDHAAALTESTTTVGPGAMLPATAEVAALLTSHLLPGWHDEWLSEDKRCFAMLRLRALEGVARHRLASEHYGPAEQAALAAIQVEPYRETTQLLLAQIYAAEGNSAQALRSLIRFGRQLRRELEMPLSVEIQRFICSLQGDVAAPRSRSLSSV